MLTPEFSELPFTIIGHAPQCVSFINLQIPKDFSFFEGHFPGHPVLPGVIILELSLFFAKELTGLTSYILKSVKKTKFIRPIFPEAQILIKLESLSDHTYRVFWKSKTDTPYATLEFTLARPE